MSKLTTIALYVNLYALAAALFVALCWLMTGFGFNQVGRVGAAVALVCSVGWGALVGNADHHREAGGSR